MRGHPLRGSGMLFSLNNFKVLSSFSISWLLCYVLSWIFFSYRARYWKDNYKHGVQEVQRVLDATYNKEVTLIEAAMRWLVHHSKLQDDDGIIIGVSKPEHMLPNNNAINDAEPLHEDVVKAFENAWDMIKSSCPKYHR